MKQTILVTGGTGFIGSHTTVELQQAGYNVVIVDDLSNSKIEVLDGIEKITGIRPAFEKVDLRDKDAAEAVFKKYPAIEGIIHFAASKAVGESVEGAGIATLLSQAFSVCLCIRFIKKKMQILIPQGEERDFDNKKISILLNNGVPMGLQFSITGIGIIMLQSANNALGITCVAAFIAAMRIKYLFTCVFENIGVAMATYCGQNLGAKKMERISQGVRSAIKMMLIFFVFSFIVITPFADDMMTLFVDKGEAEVVTYAAEFMRIACYFYPCLGLLTIFRYSIQGLGYSNLSMMSGVMEMIARCGVSLWLVPAFMWTGVCYGDPVAWVMADMFLLPAFWWLFKHLKKRII